MSGHASKVTPESILTGVQAQLQRAGRFVDTIDPAAALKTYGRLIDLLKPRLASLRVAAGLPPEPPAWASWRAREDHRYRTLPAPSDRVFTYWDRPIHTAPPLVQACVAQLRTVYPALRVLDGASVRELITVPERIEQLLEKERPAHFSDYLRTRLLEVHGGIWVDATAWVGRSLDGELQGKYLRSGTVFPRWTRRAIANWFIASHPASPLIAMQRMALETWWDENDDLPEYFLYHRVFEVLQALVPELRGQWNATPFLSAADAHLLQLEMMQPWRPQTLETIVSIAPLQKLSYKYDTVPEGSVLEHLTRDFRD